MANKQLNANEVIAQAVAEVARAPIQAMGAAGAERTKNMGPRIGGPIIEQPTFSWEAEDKCNDLKHFRLEVNNIFKSYSTPHAKQLAITKNWLGRKGLQFLETLTQTEQENVSQQKIS